MRRIAFNEGSAQRAHALLAAAYLDGFGNVPDFDTWWGALVSDTEYDADLCFLFVDENQAAAGFAQCWTSAFIKDIAVGPAWRGEGVGDALMSEIFLELRSRGAQAVRLKVHADNAHALKLYMRWDMRADP